jgi:deoxyhypusine monooxygenase
MPEAIVSGSVVGRFWLQRNNIDGFSLASFHSIMAAATDDKSEADDSVIASLRTILTSETQPLARRFRALFSLKHLASANPPTDQTLPAIEAIAAALTSPSALLKHELAYCLGQTRNHAAVTHLQNVLKDVQEDPMCRHEAAEALGALGDESSLQLLKDCRDKEGEEIVVKETCEIAVERIEWEHSKKKQEKLKKRCVIFERLLFDCSD